MQKFWPKIRKILVYISMPILLFTVVYGNYVWRNNSAIDNQSFSLFGQGMKDISENSFSKIGNYADGFLVSQLIKSGELDSYILTKFSNEDIIIQVYDINQEAVNFLQKIYPEILNLPASTQKLFYIESQSKAVLYLKKDWLVLPNSTIQDVKEYYHDSKEYWIIMESNRLIVSKKLFKEPKVVTLVDKNLNELVVSKIEQVINNKICVKLVDNFKNTLNKKENETICYNIYPDGRYQTLS